MSASRSVEGSSRAPDTGERPSGATAPLPAPATAIVGGRRGCRFLALSATLTASRVRSAVRGWPEGRRGADGRSALPMWRELVATEQDQVVCDRKEEPRRGWHRPGDGPHDRSRGSRTTMSESTRQPRWLRRHEAQAPTDPAAASRYWSDVSRRYADKADRLATWAIGLNVVALVLAVLAITLVVVV